MRASPTPHQGTSLPYRADIDGLRAVSVVSVVLFHVGMPYFSGGFVGVDVFFVISGYLITSIVLAEMRAGTFTFARFYERRARRLLPTLTVVLIATFAAGLVLMTPQDLNWLSRSMFYALIFVANLFFADQGGYFSPSMELWPLLHVWSLSVEEQFYIVWPLLLVLVLRYAPRWLPLVAVALLVASFEANVVFVAQKPLAAFYMPHTRAWELLVGCILAMGVPRLGRIAADVAGLVGLALIAWAVFTFTSETEFPGTAALLPVLGAALVIWSSQAAPSLVARLLSLPALVFVGLVSYAWYLWHWPMIALFRYTFERPLSGIEMVVVIAVSFALAALSWKYLEQPVRRGTWWKPRPRAVGTAVAASVSLVALAGAGYATNGFVDRYPQAMHELTREWLVSGSSNRDCSGHSAAGIAAGELCYLWKASDGAPGILLWGDSHAGMLVKLFGDTGEATDISVVRTGIAACPPLIGAGRKRRRGGPNEACKQLNDAVGALLKRHKFTDVVLAARWNYYVGGENGDGVPSKEQHYFQDGQSAGGTLAENREIIARGLRRTLEAIAASGARAWIVMEVPYAGFDVANRMARDMIWGTLQETRYGMDLAEYKRRSAVMEEILAGLPVRIIQPADRLCENGRCLVVANGRPLYYDDNHVSIYGGARLTPLLRDLFPRKRDDHAISKGP